jgi:hypothetical protein
VRDFVAAAFIFGGLGVLGYAGWRAYRRYRGSGLSEGHPRLRWIVMAGVGLFLLGGVVAPSERGARDDEPVAERKARGTDTPISSTSPMSTSSASELVAHAEQAVKEDDYSKAVTIVAALGGIERARVRRAISRRLASRARSALHRACSARQPGWRRAKAPSSRSSGPSWRSRWSTTRRAHAISSRPAGETSTWASGALPTALRSLTPRLTPWWYSCAWMRCCHS